MNVHRMADWYKRAFINSNSSGEIRGIVQLLGSAVLKLY